MFWKNQKLILIFHNKLNLYLNFLDFCINKQVSDIDVVKDLLRFDILINDNIKNIPQELVYTIDDDERKILNTLFQNESF